MESKREFLKDELDQWKRDGVEIQRQTKEHENSEKEATRKQESEKHELRKVFNGMKQIL